MLQDNILGVKITPLTYPALLQQIENWLILKNSNHYISVAAVSSINSCQNNPLALTAFNNADIVASDGMPLVFLLKKRGHQCERIYGPDLMLKVLALTEKKGYRNFFFGSKQEILDKLLVKLRNKFPNLVIAGSISPPFKEFTPDENEEFARNINNSDADIVWVAMTSPKQDIWMHKIKNKLKNKILFGVGAAFPIHAGVVKQAPRWMMQFGLEWLFRLIVEPKRLWKRYFFGNTYFILKYLFSKILKNNE